ncbi:AAC(3) family N-acetyltransferase [Streptomyces sp. NPDC005301]|uniref:aminoglycoside N(3)-acetyltransferase n=1 Tax=Streptomyces sp. NPDC005301 TaxID=3156874 RepID=UPI0033B7ECE5
MNSGHVVTRDVLARGLAGLGVRPGATVIAHTSLSSFGYVVGGAHSVLLALRDAVGAAGTLVMPAFTPQLCHPHTWRRPELAHAAADPATAAQMPCFDARRTPVARTMGVLPELLRTQPGARRSGHPHVSFTAQGPRAERIVAEHPLAWRLAAHGPLGRLWDLDATVLLLGTRWQKCTALHLAEYATAYPGRRAGWWSLPVPGPLGRTSWRQVPELLVWEGDFDALGDAYQAAGRPLATAQVAGALCRAVPLRELVTFACQWLADHRDLRRGLPPPGWRDVIPAPRPLPPGLLPTPPQPAPPTTPQSHLPDPSGTPQSHLPDPSGTHQSRLPDVSGALRPSPPDAPQSRLADVSGAPLSRLLAPPQPCLTATEPTP